MRRVFFCLTVLFRVAACRPDRSPRADYDVIIVGAGLSGLTVGALLRSGGFHDFIILEQDSRTGGRIETRKYDSIIYEMGALTAYPIVRIPGVEIPENRLIREKQIIGLYRRGRLALCKQTSSCVMQLFGTSSSWDSFVSGDMDYRALPPRLQGVADLFLNAFLPGSFSQHTMLNGQVVREAIRTDHYSSGNEILIKSLSNSLGAKIKLSSKVIEYRENQGLVDLTYEHRGERRNIRAKVLVVACYPPNEKLEYTHGRVVNIIVESQYEFPAGYLILAENRFGAIFFRRTKNKRLLNIVAYDSHNSSPTATQRDAKSLLMFLRKIFPGFQYNKIVHVDQKIYERISPVLSQRFHERMRELKKSSRIRYAGDFTEVEQGLPFGMPAALTSAQKTARRTQEYLRRYK